MSQNLEKIYKFIKNKGKDTLVSVIKKFTWELDILGFFENDKDLSATSQHHSFEFDERLEVDNAFYFI